MAVMRRGGGASGIREEHSPIEVEADGRKGEAGSSAGSLGALVVFLNDGRL